jgi:hypothetical protein
MARYQQNKNKLFCLSLFEECFGDLTIAEKIELAKKIGKIQKVCKL